MTKDKYYYCKLGKRDCPLAKQKSSQPAVRDFPVFCLSNCPSVLNGEVKRQMMFKYRKMVRAKAERDRERMNNLIDSIEKEARINVVESKRKRNKEEQKEWKDWL